MPLPLALVGFLAGPIGGFFKKYLIHIIIAAVIAAGAWFIWHHYTSLVEENEANKKALILKDEELKRKQRELDLAIEINRKNEAVIQDLQAAQALNKKVLAEVRTDLKKQSRQVAEMKSELAKIKEVAALTPPLRFAVGEMNRLQNQLFEDLGEARKPAAKPAPKPAPTAVAPPGKPAATIEWSKPRAPLTNLAPARNGGTR